jgi:glycosyltransferase involved in cell wall biosynthesis
MNIVFVTLGSPYPPDSGVRIRDYQIITRIAAHHSVTLLGLLYSEDEVRTLSHLEQFCDRVDYEVMRPDSVWKGPCRLVGHLKAGRPLATYPFYYDGMAQKIRRAVLETGAKIVQVEHSFLAPYIEAIRANAGCKAVLSLHNLGVRQYGGMRHLNMTAAEKAESWLKWLAMIGWEARYASRFDRTITVSRLERDLLRSGAPRLTVDIIPNGCDTRAVVPLPEATAGNGLLYVGTLGYPPNSDAVLHFTQTILPLIRRRVPDTTLVVVGHRPSPAVRRLADRGDIVLAGTVSDLLPYYREAKVCIVPLRAGGGTRLKILEAMALGRPVVSTQVGCEGLEVSDGEHLLVADAPADFADRVVQLITDAQLRQRLRQNARALVESVYDWSVICHRLLRLYEELAQS